MAKNKQPSTVDLEEGSHETNATSNEPKVVSDQVKEPITSCLDVPLVKAMTPSDKPRSCFEVPVLWPSSANHNYCCIYKVPCRLRRVNPEAYTPQMLLIGPLHHSKKALADELSKTDCRYLEYMKMEQHKEKYLQNFAHTYGQQTVDEFRRITKRDEEIIRACYAESTDSIKSDDFVEMMLLDSVFILMFFLQDGFSCMERTGDFIFDEPCHQETIMEDLILLENQLPYILLENLFDHFFRELGVKGTFRDLTLEAFGFKEKIKAEVNFLHFTDLFRRVRVQTLGLTEEQETKVKRKRKKINTSIRNAVTLEAAGVRILPIETDSENERNISLVIKFERGCGVVGWHEGVLKMPCFIVVDDTETILRNIMALEQCHYSYTALVCNYINFLDSLIDSVEDVDILIRAGVIRNQLGRSKTAAEMVNKLCLGIVYYGSNYNNIVESIEEHYNNSLNRSYGVLQRVFFKDIWTGVVTIVTMLTLIGTLASVLQVVFQLTLNNNCICSLPPPPPPSA